MSSTIPTLPQPQPQPSTSENIRIKDLLHLKRAVSISFVHKKPGQETSLLY